MGWRLGGFDLDGTLIHGTTTLLHVGRHLGHDREFADLVDGYESYALTNREATACAALRFRGMTRSDLKALMAGVPVLDNLARGVEVLHQNAVTVRISTVSFAFAAEWFAEEYDFDAVAGVRLEFDQRGRATGRVLAHCDASTKARDIEQAAREQGVPTDAVFFCGDSRSDLKAFEQVGFAVAVNGTADAVAAADAAIDTSDFLDVVALVLRSSAQTQR